jgi:hypothetical protein
MPVKLDLLGDMIAGVRRNSDQQAARDLEEQRLALVAQWTDPWAWLTGKDTDGRPVIWTKDEKDRSAPLKPFPSHSRYLRELVSVLKNEPLVAIDKSRQLYVSTTILLFDDHDSAFNVAVGTVLSKTKEEDACALLRDKVRFPFRQMPQWVQQWRPITMKPEKRITYPQTGSETLAVAQNAAVGEARGRSARRAIIDEGAFQDELEEMVAAFKPMTSQIILCSSPNLGSPGAAYYFGLLERENA